jgi:hypothetical protein
MFSYRKILIFNIIELKEDYLDHQVIHFVQGVELSEGISLIP